jgi:hypothetical protein
MNLKYTLKRWHYRRKMKIPMVSKFSAKTFIEDPTNFSIDLKNLSYEKLIEVFINFVLVYDFNGTNHQLDDNFSSYLDYLNPDANQILITVLSAYELSGNNKEFFVWYNKNRESFIEAFNKR